MSQFSKAFSAFFGMLFTLFSAGEKFAKGLDQVGDVVVNATGSYADESAIDREIKKHQLMRDLELRREQMRLQTEPSKPAITA